MNPRRERQQRIHVQLEALWSLYAFVRRAWPLVEPTELLQDPRGLAYDHVATVCRHLEAALQGKLRRLIINIPPGHAKSLMTSVFFPAWAWARRPELRMLFASYDEALLARDAIKTRQILDSDWYQELFVRGAWSIRRDRNTVNLFANTWHGFRQTMTVGGGATGHRGDILVIDDPIKVMDSHSAICRDRVIEWYGETMSSRFIDPAKAVIILIMQRLHDDDLAGHLIRRGGFTLLKLQSICEHPGETPVWSDPRKTGELLFPARYPMPVIEDARVDMGAMFSGQHQQDPVDVMASLFPRSAWRFWKHPGEPDRSGSRPWGCDQGPAMELPRIEREVLSVDCGFKGKTHSDRVAMHRWGAAGAGRFLLDRRTRPLSFVDTKRDFVLFVKEHGRYDFALVEEKANGSALVDEMRHVVPRLNPENYRELVYPQDSKTVRAIAWSPMLRAGNVYLPDGADWLEEFVAEHERFPKAPHDDDVDAASLGLNALRASNLDAAIALCDLPARMSSGWGR